MLAICCAARIQTEPDDIEWIIKVIQDDLEVPMCIDSVNPEAQRAGLSVHRHGRALVNSTTGEVPVMNTMLPLVKEYNAQVVALLHDEKGMPATIEDRLIVIPKILEYSEGYGIAQHDIYADNLVFCLSVLDTNPEIYLKSLQAVKKRYPELQTICGLNNISFGLPQEELLNQAFLVMCAAYGQDAVLIDITKESSAMIWAMKALLGKDYFSMKYLDAFRRGKLDIFKAACVS